MARSGSYDYGRTAGQIVNGALRLVGAYDKGATPDASDTADAMEAFELMVKAWQAQGIHLWKLQEATLFLQKSTGSYSLSSSGAHATKSYTQTTLSVAAAAGAATVTLASVSGVATTYNIGIVLDSGALFWTTVNGAPAGNVVTLTAVTTGAAASGNRVYVYQTKIQRPLRIISARTKDTSGNEVRRELISRSEYFNLPNKTIDSTVTQAYYDPQLDSGNLYVWPRPANVDYLLNFTFEEPIQDFDALANSPDFPVEWVECLKYNLAVRLADEYWIPMDRYAVIKGKADQFLSDMLSFDNEPESFFIQPDFSR